MTPEEIEELRALVGRLGANAYDKNLAVVLGAALEHIHMQDARIADLEGDLEQEEHNSEAFMNKIGEHVCEIVDLETKIAELEASLDEAEALIKKNVEMMNGYLARIAELESQIIQQTGISASRMEERERLQKQIAALQEIAVEERASMMACSEYEPPVTDKRLRGTARDQLAEEHPEAFR